MHFFEISKIFLFCNERKRQIFPKMFIKRKNKYQNIWDITQPGN